MGDKQAANAALGALRAELGASQMAEQAREEELNALANAREMVQSELASAAPPCVEGRKGLGGGAQTRWPTRARWSSLSWPVRPSPTKSPYSRPAMLQALLQQDLCSRIQARQWGSQ